MEDITIESLIAQRRVVTTADLLNPTNDYMVVGVYQNGTNKSKGDGTSYKNYVISIAELLGGGAAYTASNGIVLIGNDFQLASGINSKVWAPDGNTFGSEKFLGTIDNFALPFRVNNNEVLRITNDAAGSTRFYFNANTNLHGSNAGIQYSSDGTSPNRSQARFNIYGANTGAPGITGFKSRGVGIGTLASVLAGDNLFRLTTIGVSGNNSSINLASLIDVRVSTVLVGHVATDFVVALNSIAGVMTERLYVTSEGNVGIGTSTPTEKLHVIGNGLFNNGQLTRVDMISSGGASDTTVRLSNTAFSNYVNITANVNQAYIDMRGSGARGINLRDAADNVSFSINEDTFNQYIDYRNDLEFRNIASGQIRASLNAAGNFGIGPGTTAPTARVQIVGASATAADFALRVDDIATTSLFSVRNDGQVNSNHGYSYNGNRLLQSDFYLGNTFLGSYGFDNTPGNTGLGVNAIGYGAGQSNSGNGVSVIGEFAALNNTGTYVVGFGVQALQGNTGNSVFAAGYQAGLGNTGNNVIGLGNFSIYNNTVNDAVIIGSARAAAIGFLEMWVGVGPNKDGTEAKHPFVIRQGSIATGVVDNSMANVDLIFAGAVGTGTGLGGALKMQVAPASGVSSGVQNTLVDVFIAKQSSVLNLPAIQTGNAGLVTGDLYVDTSANVLANGDLVVARKV